jgi:hypothetical protein
MTKFEQFKQSRRFVQNLQQFEDRNGCYPISYQGAQGGGFTYAASYDVDFVYVECTPDGYFHVIAGNNEITTSSLDEAEQFLWDNFAEGEYDA